MMVAPRITVGGAGDGVYDERQAPLRVPRFKFSSSASVYDVFVASEEEVVDPSEGASTG
jgi:hypothetical protein